MTDLQTRRQLARLSLTGLSVGDAFGQQFFSQPELVATRTLPVYPWTFTDDTVMAISIRQTLELYERIDQQDLAERFSTAWKEDPFRGYGTGAHKILNAIHEGTPWQQASQSVFDGAGSMGNGGAMRVGPIGGWFFDSPEEAAAQARLSAQVTHWHVDGQEGTVAVSVAAAACASWSQSSADQPAPNVIQVALDHCARSRFRKSLEQAKTMDDQTDVREAATALGNGERLLAEDTVPFCLWMVNRALQSDQQPQDCWCDALWDTASAFGDIDTNCAIVGSILSLAVGKEGIPEEWVLSREPLNG